MSQWHGGKGSKYRKVNAQKFADNWDRLFAPVVIEWQGKMGYGDICSPCAWVNNLAEKTGKKVILEWVVPTPEGERVCPEYEHPDSEDSILRLQKIFDMMKTEKVELKIRYNEVLPYKHTDLPKPPYQYIYLYRYFKPEYKWVGGGGYVVFNTTENNFKQWEEYGNPKAKTWKSPDSWKDTYSQFDNVKFVDYTTPIDELVEIIKYADLYIGYSGGTVSMALAMGAPSYVIANEFRRSRMCCPHAVISDKLDFDPKDIITIQKKSLDRMPVLEAEAREYINSTSDNEGVLDGDKEETKTERETGT